MTTQTVIAAILLVFAFLGSVVLFIGWCAAGYKDRLFREQAERNAEFDKLHAETLTALDEADAARCEFRGDGA